MAYLLDLLFPGLGHLAVRRYLSGLALLALWLGGEAAAFVAMSYQVWAIVALPLLWALLSLAAVLDLRLRRQKEQRPPGYGRSLLLLPLGPALFAALALFVASQLVRPMEVMSGSMTPSAVTGDWILVQLFSPWIVSVRLGDIVLVAHPQNRRLLIKRIIGVGGDLIEVRAGELRRNGRRLSECELRSLRDNETNQPVHERLEVLEGRPYLVWDQPAVRSKALSVRVPEGHLFVVGDNRDRSGDSRSFGTVPVSSVRGLVTARVFPVLTNEIYRAPLKARQAAFQRCSARQGATDRSEDRAAEPSPAVVGGGTKRWPTYRAQETKRR